MTEPPRDPRVEKDRDRVTPEANQVSAVEKREILASRTDEDLIQSVAQGEKVAFDELVRRHKVRLYNYLLRLLRDPTEAEEITQETFIRAYRALGGYSPDRIRELRPRGWLAAIVSNLGRNRARREDRRHSMATQRGR